VARGPSVPECLPVLCPRCLDDILPQPPYVALMVTSRDGLPSEDPRWGSFTSRAAIASACACPLIVFNLPFGVSVFAGDTSKAHQAPRQLTSCQAFACIWPVMRDDRGRRGTPRYWVNSPTDALA
jgi:hypothetical protein